MSVGVCDEVERIMRDLYPLRRWYSLLNYCKHVMSKMSRTCSGAESEHVDTECCLAWLVKHDLEYLPDGFCLLEEFHLMAVSTPWLLGLGLMRVWDEREHVRVQIVQSSGSYNLVGISW